ncbi:MAG: EAL domain-containing protein [Porticoccaceae bacterium]
MIEINSPVRAALLTLLFAELVVAALLFSGGHGWYLAGLVVVAWLACLMIVALPAPRGIVQRVDGSLERRFLIDSLGEHSPIIYTEVNRQGTITELGGSALALVGDSMGAAVGDDVRAIMGGDEQIAEDVHRAMAGEHFVCERLYGPRYYRHHFFPSFSRAGEMLGYSSVSIDLTQERKLRTENDLLRKVLQNTTDAISIADRYRRVIGINSAFSAITGYSDDEVTGRKAGLPQLEVGNLGFFRDIARSLKTRGVWQGEVWARRKSGELYSAALTLSAVRENGAIAHYLCFFSDTTDLTDIRRSREELQHQVNHDQLTGLPNRRLFLDRLEQAMKRARRLGGSLAVFFIDLDNFKLVNDFHGHQAGDQLLRTVGARLGQSTRDVDTVARLAGDEFTVIVENVDKHAQILAVADKIVECFSQPFVVDGQSLEISASIGIGVYPDDGEDVLSLLDGADVAMYKAKAQGRNGFFYLSETAGDTRGQLAQAADLRFAIDREQLELLYQPLMSLNSGAVVGCEALLRWNHGSLGVVSPRDFLPAVEAAGGMPQLGTWVVHEACRQYDRWRRQGLALDLLSINIASHQLDDVGFLDRAREAVDANRLNPAILVLDIPETLVLADRRRAQDFIAKAHARGFSCAINDFGASGKPFDYLRDLPVAMIKLDRQMISVVRGSSDSQPLINAIVTLANLLGIKVLGVGVEHSRQEGVLRGMGCHFAQGYLYSRPLKAEEFSAYCGPALPLQDVAGG